MTQLIGADITATYDATQLAQQGPAGLGDLYTSSSSKVYKFVQYETAAGAVAAVSGNVCYYYAPGGVSAGSTTVVTSDLSDSAGLGAGVLQSAPADGEYCWVQIKGSATLTTALTAGADGNALTPVGSTDGTLDVSALVTDSICAYAVDASAKIVMCDFPY
jgi:hypothetical protein|tara:strand:+ start:47 stop:529 length:483 start_codon:yes stop_codon:yes gene_type:complete